ncbi:hypothetical protein CBL17_25370, partial [Shigella sonnei]
KTAWLAAVDLITCAARPSWVKQHLRWNLVETADDGVTGVNTGYDDLEQKNRLACSRRFDHVRRASVMGKTTFAMEPRRNGG